MSYSDYDSEESVDWPLPRKDENLGVSGGDDDMAQVENDLDEVDQVGTEPALLRKIAAVANYMSDCADAGLCQTINASSRMLPLTLPQHATTAKPTLTPSDSFLVMDSECVSVVNKPPGGKKQLLFAPLELTLAACSGTDHTVTLKEHYFIDAGLVTETLYSDELTHPRALTTYHYGVTRCHGLGVGRKDDAVVAPGTTGARCRSDFLKMWTELTALVKDHGNVIAVKNGHVEKCTLLWMLEMARKEDPSLPDHDFCIVDVTKFDSLNEGLLEPLWGKDTTRSSTALLPMSERYMNYSFAPSLGAWFEGESYFSDMDEDGNFSGGLSKYCNELTVRHILAIHEAKLWSCNESSCAFHKGAADIHNHYFPHDEGDDDKGRPFHMHCSRKDTLALANGLAAVLSMK